MDTLFSVKAAALYLGGVSEASIRFWLCKGRLAKVKIGRRTMIRESELHRFIAIGDESQESVISASKSREPMRAPLASEKPIFRRWPVAANKR